MLNVKWHNHPLIKRYQLVDYLTTTGIYEFAFEGSLPEEAPPFKSLWLPFDPYTWAFGVGTIIIAIFTLILIDRNWSQLVKDNTKSLVDHTSEGQLKRSQGIKFLHSHTKSKNV